MSESIVQKAILTVGGFENVSKTLKQQVILKGQSQSTLDNYIRRIVLICLYFDRLPVQIYDDELNECLTSLAIDKSPIHEAVSNTWFMGFVITSV